MKQYRLNYTIGKAKYVISYHDGVKTHNDGSPFFDIEICGNIKKFTMFERKLLADGYTQIN